MTLTLVKAWTAAKDRLKDAGIDQPSIDARLMLEVAAGVTRTEIVTDPYRELTTEQQATLEDYLARRARREPVSHIIGRKGFWKILLQVNKNVLTPRPETEVIVDEVLKAFPEQMPFSMLDLGVGSGTILLAVLAERPETGVVGLNLGANKASADRAADFAEVLSLAGPVIDFATVNVSSPNTERLRDLQGRAALDALLAGVMAANAALASPVPILHTLMTDAFISARYRLDGVIVNADEDEIFQFHLVSRG